MSVQNSNTKRFKKRQIARLILEFGGASKNEIASALHISMPTVLNNIRELMDDGIITESGVYHSTGGRHPKAYTICGDIAYAVGIDITAHHLSLALVNLKQELLQFDRIRLPFQASPEYFARIQTYFTTFLDQANVPISSILGAGISLPGIVDNETQSLIRSHILEVENFSFRPLSGLLKTPVYLENDANSAALAELSAAQNAVYLSLSSSVGGALYLDGKLYRGEKNKAGEFGHLIIEQNGRPCYCGKRGCIDAYCSAQVLQRAADDDLELFFERLYQKDPRCVLVWDDYLEHLAVAVTNLRMIFDCDIILGGHVGGYLKDYRLELTNRIRRCNNFDTDSSYLRLGRFKQEASAYGITRHYIDSFFDRLTESSY